MKKYKWLVYLLLVLLLCWGGRFLWLIHPEASFPLNLNWQVNLGNSTYERPAYQDGLVLLPADSPIFSYWYGVEATTGKVIWSKKVKSDSYLRCLTPDYLVLSGPQSLLTLETGSGEIVWQRERAEAATCSKTMVFTIVPRRLIQTFNLTTGEEIWSGTNPPEPFLALTYNPDTEELIADGAVIVDPASGKILRSFEPSFLTYPPVEQERGIMLLIDNGQLFIGESVRDATTGQVIHEEERYNGRLPPTVTTDTIYISTSQTRGVVALDRTTFEVKWTYEPQHWLSVRTVSPVTVLDGVGYVVAADVSLRAFDLTTGQELGHWRPGWLDLLRWSVCISIIPGCMQPDRAGLATSEDMLFVSFGDGKLYAFGK